MTHPDDATAVRICAEFCNDKVVWHCLTLDPPVLARAVASAIQACAGQKGGG